MNWVVLTGKGDAFIVGTASASMAITRFQKHFPGTEVAQCFQARLLQ